MKTFTLFSIVLISLLLNGCATKQKTTNVDNLKSITYEDINKNIKNLPLSKIEKDIDITIKELKDSQLNINNCSNYIEIKTSYLLNNAKEEYLSSKEELNYITNRAYPIVNKLFTIRILLKDQFKSLNSSYSIDQKCINSFRKSFRYVRFLEEFITELGVSKYKNRKEANAFDFSTNAFQFYLNPKYKEFELKSGDILLMRPSNYVSAAIARIGDEDGQFSHGSIVYINKNDEIFIIESLISKGLVLTPYEIWRKKNHNARIVQFRFNDEKKASLLVKDYYNKKIKNFNNKSIVYDFQMNENTPNELFCTEVIYQVFKNENIPTYKTSFLNFKNHNFLKNLTIEVDSAFAPSDIEIEPKFELVSEWRNYDTTNLTRIQDAIITSIFKWMSNDNFRLKSTFKSSIKTNIAFYGRHLFGLFDDKIPKNMPYGFLQTLIELGNVNELLEAHLTKLNKNHLDKYDYPMTYKDMLLELEKFKNSEELKKLLSSI